MALRNIILEILCIALVDAYILAESGRGDIQINDFNTTSDNLSVNGTFHHEIDESNASEAFNGVYAECFLYLSYTCIQKKTLLYLQKLNDLREISVLGEYLKFVKINTTQENSNDKPSEEAAEGSVELTSRIDRAVDRFFDNHLLRFKALGKDIVVPRSVEEFVGRKKRKGGGGGGGGGHGHDDGDGGKKKMMMMAMMCMKMKLMMMVPAMMGMMGMMSFKGMMFSMMSFMISKMMLLMKILEKKGGMGGGGGDPGWAAGGSGGGAWMPAGGSPDYGGGGGGGYDANGQWQSRSIPEDYLEDHTYTIEGTPEITYIKPTVRYMRDPVNDLTKDSPKSRKKRGLFDVIQNAYLYWINRMLGVRRYNKLNQQKYRIINGVKYVYYPLRYVKVKPPKAVANDVVANDVKEEYKPITVQDFNKGEIVDSPEESRMNKKKFQKMKDTVDAAVDDNPWE